MPGDVRHVIVDAARAGQRLDNFLMTALGAVPRSLVYRLVRKGQVRVNGARARPHHRLAQGDEVRLPPVRRRDPGPVRIPDELLREIGGRVLLETPELIVIDKPAGLAMHSGSGLKFGLTDVVEKLYPGARPAHRLDRPTSGLVVFGRDRPALQALQRAFTQREVDKRYLALMTGRLPEARMTVDAPLKKIHDAGGQRRMVVDEGGERAVSHFHVMERLPGYTFVEVTIETGRTHQIRAHARHLGHPLAGDSLYNPETSPAGLGRLFLHAHYLRLLWPEERLLNSPLPDELKSILDTL